MRNHPEVRRFHLPGRSASPGHCDRPGPRLFALPAHGPPRRRRSPRRSITPKTRHSSKRWRDRRFIRTTNGLSARRRACQCLATGGVLAIAPAWQDETRISFAQYMSAKEPRMRCVSAGSGELVGTRRPGAAYRDVSSRHVCDTAVPVRLGDKLIGFLQTGQVFRRNPAGAIRARRRN